MPGQCGFREPLGNGNLEFNIGVCSGRLGMKRGSYRKIVILVERKIGPLVECIAHGIDELFLIVDRYDLCAGRQSAYHQKQYGKISAQCVLDVVLCKDRQFPINPQNRTATKTCREQGMLLYLYDFYI